MLQDPLSFRSPFSGFEVLLYPEFDDLPDQSERQRFFDRELHRSLGILETFQLFLEDTDSFCAGIESYMILVRSKMNQISIEIERRDLITDFFFRLRSILSNEGPQTFQNFLNVFRERADIMVDIFIICLHGFSGSDPELFVYPNISIFEFQNFILFLSESQAQNCNQKSDRSKDQGLHPVKSIQISDRI